MLSDQCITFRGCLNTDTISPTVTEICICNGDNCNKDICPKQRLKCFQCQGTSNCVKMQNLEPKVCSKYIEGDQCYVYVEDDGKTHRGCVSDEGNGPQRCNALKDLCIKSQFNNQPGVTSDFSCVRCESSATDDSCASKTDRDTCPDVYLGRSPECFTINDGEKITRDCYQGTNIQKCVNAGTQCKRCDFDGCNNEVFKSIKCKKCENCQSNVASGYCFVEKDNDNDLACYHKEEANTVTYRDCTINSPNVTACVCRDNLCNDFDCPENRLKCHQCEGCLTIQPSDVKFNCPNYDPNDQCYTLLDDSESPEKIYRGCLSDKDTLGVEKCKNDPKHCITSTEENNQPGFSDSFSCVQCRTDTIDQTDECFNATVAETCGDIPLGREIGCFTLMDGEKLIRDCYYGPKMKECDDDPDNCEICSESECNTKPFRSLNCRKCDSNKDKSCSDQKGDDSQFGFCFAERFSEEELACYRHEFIENGEKVVKRGCLNTIENELIKDDCKSNSNECKICHDPRCNDKVDFQKCYNCTSNENDENCATLQTPQNLPWIICPGYYDQCATSLTGIAAQDTRRSCISDPGIECPDSYCEACTSNYCNKDAYPDTRIKCHRCNETTDQTCANNLLINNKFLHYCPKYDKDRGDTCFGVIDTNGVMIRGCRTDFIQHEECIKRGENCILCTEEGCNKGPKFREPKLKCIDCEPSNLLGNCLWGVNPTKAKTCINDVGYGYNEYCFITQYGSEVARRGCLNDFPDICNDSNVSNCTKCDSDACNNANRIQQACIVCNSVTTPGCEYANPNLPATSCTDGIQEFDERWCYTMRNSDDNRVTRGCFMDLPADLKEICKDMSKKTCEVCHEWGCNKLLPPSSSNDVRFSVMVIIFGVILNLVQ
uniref:CSON014778 protein n=1 Tax=Culicoides sonorensis TaxID=179676 RepID=A0A336LNX4_CULSO